MPPWALVTPASRGIGFAITRRILQTSKVPVVATARKDADQTKEKLLEDLKDVDESRLTVLKLDVTDEATVESAASDVGKKFSKDNHHLHLAFAIPGILIPEKAPSQIDYNDALQQFKVNALGPLLLIKHFSHFLPTKKTTLPPKENAEEYEGLNPDNATWATMSARVGSVSDNNLGGWYSYRSSKSAVNQIVKSFDNYLKTASSERAMSVGLHPGTVKTGLSKEFWGSVKKEKLFTPEFSAERLVELCTRTKDEGGIGLEGRGRIWDWDGKEVQP